jgi:hypothetical protein
MDPSAPHHDETNGAAEWERRYDWSQTSPSEAVLETVGSVSGTDLLELPPMNNVVDLDALDAIVRHGRRRRRTSIDVSFRYQGYTVVVRMDGTVRLVTNDGDEPV